MLAIREDGYGRPRELPLLGGQWVSNPFSDPGQI